MNNGRIWCVVNPTVGLPLFLGSVALMAFTVHFAVLNNTSWFPAYWNGSATAKTAQATTGTTPAFVVDVAPKTEASGTSFVITVTPKATETPALKTADASGSVAR